MLYSYLIYNLIFFFSILCVFLSEGVEDVILKKSLRMISLIFVLFFTVIRFDVGPDYLNYKEAYDTVIYYNLEQSLDYQFFVIVSKLSSYFFFSRGYIVVFAIYFLITYFIIYKELLQRHMLFWGLLTFFCFGFYFDSLDRIRQFLALAVFIFSIKFIEKDEFLKFMSVIMFGSLFHVSLLLVTPIYFLSKITIRLEVYLTIILILIFITIFKSNLLILNVIYDLIPFYSKFQGTGLSLQVASYATGVGYFSKILFLLYVTLSINNNNKLKSIMFFGIVIELLGGGNLNVSRFAAYFTSTLIFIFPLFIQDKKNDRIKTLLPVLFLFSIFQKDIAGNGFEYRTIFSEQYDYQWFYSRE